MNGVGDGISSSHAGQVRLHNDAGSGGVALIHMNILHLPQWAGILPDSIIAISSDRAAAGEVLPSTAIVIGGSAPEVGARTTLQQVNPFVAVRRDESVFLVKAQREFRTAEGSGVGLVGDSERGLRRRRAR